MDHRVKDWIAPQFPKLEERNTGSGLKDELGSGEAATLKAERGITFEYQGTPVEIASNKLLAVEHYPLRIEILIDDRYRRYWLEP